jgi:hypothetical protein
VYLVILWRTNGPAFETLRRQALALRGRRATASR